MQVDFQGPAGRLEGALWDPEGEPLAAAVVCHPHPLHGGTMHNNVVFRTARALQEAQQKGIETFCMTVDKSGHDYLKRMCPDERYMIIEEMEDLPNQLTKVYTALTGK